MMPARMTRRPSVGANAPHAFGGCVSAAGFPLVGRAGLHGSLMACYAVTRLASRAGPAEINPRRWRGAV